MKAIVVIREKDTLAALEKGFDVVLLLLPYQRELCRVDILIVPANEDVAERVRERSDFPELCLSREISGFLGGEFEAFKVLSRGNSKFFTLPKIFPKIAIHDRYRYMYDNRDGLRLIEKIYPCIQWAGSYGNYYSNYSISFMPGVSGIFASREKGVRLVEAALEEGAISREQVRRAIDQIEGRTGNPLELKETEEEVEKADAEFWKFHEDQQRQAFLENMAEKFMSAMKKTNPKIKIAQIKDEGDLELFRHRLKGGQEEN